MSKRGRLKKQMKKAAERAEKNKLKAQNMKSPGGKSTYGKKQRDIVEGGGTSGDSCAHRYTDQTRYDY